MNETLVDITTSNHQPVIIIIGDDENLKVQQIFIKVDHTKLHVPGTNLSFCLDYFFKLFWIFEISCCEQLTNFMQFFELIFNLKSKKNKACLNEFLLKL